MNPETRIIKKITIDDAARADRTFTTLMGEDVPPRKKFIQTRAKMAEIDV
jgi:DNA gyrase subunit B